MDQELVERIARLEREVEALKTLEFTTQNSQPEFIGDVRLAGGISVGNVATDPANGQVIATADIKTAQGLSVGSSTTNPATGNVQYTGNLIADRAANHTGYIYVPLNQSITVESTNATTSSSAVAVNIPTSIPIEAKAYNLRIAVLSTHTSGESYVFYGPDNGSTPERYHIGAYARRNTMGWVGNTSVVANRPETSRRIYRTIQVAGGTLTWFTDCVGYYI